MDNIKIVERYDYKGGYKTGCDIVDSAGKCLARIRANGRGGFCITDQRDRVSGVPPQFPMQKGTKKELIAAFKKHLAGSGSSSP